MTAAQETALALDRITVDTDVQIRDRNDGETVRQYMEILDQLPPVAVFDLGEGTLLLADGFHRVEAAQRLGREEVRAEVREGTREEALEFAVLPNAHHGKALNQRERE